jgi:hypothetical protein
MLIAPALEKHAEVHHNGGSRSPDMRLSIQKEALIDEEAEENSKN